MAPRARFHRIAWHSGQRYNPAMRPQLRWLTTAMLLRLCLGCNSEQPAPSSPASSKAPAVQTATRPAGASEDNAGEPAAPQQPYVATTPTSSTQAPAAEASPAPAPEAAPPFLPLRDAAVGETAVYRDRDGHLLQYEIISVDDGTITARVSIRDAHGRLLGQPATRTNARDEDLLATQAARTQAARTARPVRIKAAGREWDALLYEDRWSDEEVHYVRRSWVSPDVPVFGLIRMELTGDGALEASLELRSFAFPGSQERTP